MEAAWRCQLSTRTLREPFIVTDELRSRFFAKTASASTGCMVWTGCVQRNGYGAFKICGTKIDAHVASWRISQNGLPVPIGKLIMHSCDMRCCVNPDHLVLGTVSENMLHAHQNGNGDIFTLKGEECYQAVLTEDVVGQIRELHVPRRFGATRIAKRLGLKRGCVDAVLRNRTWRHLLQEVSQ